MLLPRFCSCDSIPCYYFSLEETCHVICYSSPFYWSGYFIRTLSEWFMSVPDLGVLLPILVKNAGLICAILYQHYILIISISVSRIYSNICEDIPLVRGQLYLQATCRQTFLQKNFYTSCFMTSELLSDGNVWSSLVFGSGKSGDLKLFHEVI